MTLNKLVDLILYAIIFSTPLFFLPNVLEPIESGKQSWFFILISIALITAAIEFFKKDKLVFRKNLISWLLVLFLGLLAISAAVSDSHLLSWVGFSKQEYTSFASLLFFGIFFWLVGSHGRETGFFSRSIVAAMFGGILAGLIGTASIFGLFLPFSFAQTTAFNTVGTVNTLGIFLIILTVLANSFFLLWQNKKPTIPIIVIALSAITFVYLALANYWLLWIILLVGLGLLIIMVFLRAHELQHTKKYLLAMFLIVGSLFFLIVPLRLTTVPTEVSPNTSTSWQITKQVMAGKNFWFGSGPGTYVFDFARFRPIEINQTNFWNTRFDRGSSEFLTILPTKGFLPTTALFIFALSLTFVLIKTYALRQENQWPAFILIPVWMAALLSCLVYTSNFTLVLLFFFLGGLVYSLTEGKNVKINLEKTSRLKLASHLIPALIIVMAVISIFLVGQRALAESIFTKAVRLDRDNGATQEVTKLIDQAASMNRFNDSYYRNLAAILLVEVENEIATIGTNQPAEEQSKYLQALVAASVNAAKHATELEPKNVVNWLELGTVYRSFVPVTKEAGEFSVSAFQTALELEPNNPENYIDLGKTYLAVAAVADEDNKASNFLLADQAIQKAIDLKNDYAPAHYQLALSYEQQGRLDDAIGKMEDIIKYNPRDIGAGFELGVLYLRRGRGNDLDAAENILKQVVNILPSYSNAHWYLGYIYEQKRDFESAIAEIEKVFELNPDNEMVKIHLENLKNGLPPAVENPVAPEPIIETETP